MITRQGKRRRKMRVRQAIDKDKSAWDAYVNNHPDSTPYSLFPWKEAVEQAYGHQSSYLLAEEGGVIKGVLPLFIFHVPFRGNALVSLPYCDVGDVLADNDEIKKALLTETILLAKKLNVKAVDIRSCRENLLEDIVNDWHVSVKTEKVRMVLPLPGSSAELWERFKSKLRSQIRKAEKNGLSFSWGSEKDIDAFYHVFSRNMHELGSPVHSKKWIEQILLNYGDNARMGLVFKENQPVGCGIILFTKHSVSIPWASTLREYNKLSPNMMLYWNFLKFAADTGKKVFDFGRSTLNEGTYKFKKQWGAEPEQLFWYSVNETPQTSEEAAMGKNRVRLEQIWQKMPISLVNFIGPKVRKYISL